ncbi:oligosaccharide flippase family protein [Crenalkalicoccus roseus]|uniref:oligosaccharide flippase family protein n=1 Tax=Crenalkalicoccus roseus TaxID=1485588 RepID=UPI001081D276|nr:oligosaccharide flippase family protein [Crenalkalicoccus roseus]
MLIARAIGPEAAGTGAIAIAAFLLADLAGAALFTDAVVQRRGLSRLEARSAVTAQVLAGLAGAAVLAALAPVIARQVGVPEVQPLILTLAGLLPFSAFSGAVSGLVLREGRYLLLALRALIGLPLALAAGLAVAQAGHGPWAMVAHQMTATLLVFLLLLTLARQRLRPRLSLRALGVLWPVAGPQVLSVIVQAGRYRLFVLALGTVVAEAVVAVSNVAFRLVDAVLAVVWTATPRIALPRFSALQHDRKALAEAYGDVAELQALIGMPIATGVALIAPDLVQALLGPVWAPAAEAARVVGLVAVASFAYGDAGSLFVALGKARRNLLVAGIAMAMPLLALLLLRPESPIGVAWCWAASTLVIAPFVTFLALREIRRSPLWLLGRIAPALAATGVMAVAVLLLREELALPPLPRLAAAALAGALVFALVAWLAIGRRVPRALRPLPAAAE